MRCDRLSTSKYFQPIRHPHDVTCGRVPKPPARHDVWCALCQVSVSSNARSLGSGGPPPVTRPRVEGLQQTKVGSLLEGHLMKILDDTQISRVQCGKVGPHCDRDPESPVGWSRQSYGDSAARILSCVMTAAAAAAAYTPDHRTSSARGHRLHWLTTGVIPITCRLGRHYRLSWQRGAAPSDGCHSRRGRAVVVAVARRCGGRMEWR